MVARTHLNVAIYVYCLYCFKYYKKVLTHVKALWILDSTNVITATCVQTQRKHMKNVSMMLTPPKTGTADLPNPETMWRPTGLPTYISRPWYDQEHPIKCHKWQREGSRSIHLLILNWRQTGVGGQGHAPAALPPGKSAGTYCTRGWVSPRPVCTALEKKEFPVPTTVWSPDRPARSQSLHWVRYPDPYPLVYSSQREEISFKSCFIAQPCNRTYFSDFYTN